jgi:hypothetical protein
MLLCTMSPSAESLRLGLEDLLGDLTHARRTGDLGRVALLVYCELRRWARQADMPRLADHANVLFLGAPYADRAAFLAEVDALIAEAQQALLAMPPRAVLLKAASPRR